MAVDGRAGMKRLPSANRRLSAAANANEPQAPIVGDGPSSSPVAQGWTGSLAPLAPGLATSVLEQARAVVIDTLSSPRLAAPPGCQENSRNSRLDSPAPAPAVQQRPPRHDPSLVRQTGGGQDRGARRMRPGGQRPSSGTTALRPFPNRTPKAEIGAEPDNSGTARGSGSARFGRTRFPL